jgi:tetratricopeptide (TPR) repeat protein
MPPPPAIVREIGYRQGEAADLGNLGGCYADLGQAADAIEHHRQALAIAWEIGYRRGEAHQRLNLGEAYADQGDWVTRPACRATSGGFAAARVSGRT